MRPRRWLLGLTCAVLVGTPLSMRPCFAQRPAADPFLNGGPVGSVTTVGRWSGRGWSLGGWGCRPCGRRPACGWPRGCGPRICGGPGFRLGWPGCGFGGWAGSATFIGSQSVFLAAPYGGGATFFSGTFVPYVLPYAVPYAVPYPVPYAVPVPWFGAVDPGPVRPLVAAARPGGNLSAPAPHAVARAATAPPRPVAAAGRRRARELVARGDRMLREAGDAVQLRAAEVVYRRAAAAAGDEPDVHIRHAIVLRALGRQEEAAAAAGRAVDIDGRLVDRPDQREAGGQPPLVARGAALLRSIAAVEDGPLPVPLATLAAVWSGAAVPPPALAAAGGASAR